MTRFNAAHALVLGDTEFEAGENEVTKPSKELLRLLNHAYAAGVITDLEDADPAAYGVQSQEDGELAYAEAQASGKWQEGNVLAQAESLATAELPIDVVAAEDPEE
jgi:hypothetical protein